MDALKDALRPLLNKHTMGEILEAMAELAEENALTYRMAYDRRRLETHARNLRGMADSTEEENRP